MRKFLKLLWGNFTRALVIIFLVLLVISYFVAIVAAGIGFMDLMRNGQQYQASIIAIVFIFLLAFGIAVGATVQELE